MKVFLIILLILVILLFLLTYGIFFMAFYVPKRNSKKVPEYDIPPGKIYKPYHDSMIRWIKEVRAMKYEEFTITSFDGLKLYGKYYECEKGAPIELMFHGYRGTADRDLSGGVQRCFALGRNVLIVDQRASGKSDGHVISFGVNESRDCLKWIDFLLSHFGDDIKIILTGISMGASTVMMATGYDLPKNVVCVLADCGYSSAKDIIKKVIRQLHLPANVLYPFAKLGARIFGHFHLEENPPVEALKKCKVPVIFIHGEADDYVPCDMSRINYDACNAPKTILTVPGAGHGLGYLVGQEDYFRTLIEFCNSIGLPTNLHTTDI